MTYSVALEESNHGRALEIIVAVASENPADVEQYKIPQAKIRGGFQSAFQILRGRPFKWGMVTKEQKKLLGDGASHKIKVIAYAELIRSFYRQGIEIENVLIDGDFSRSNQDLVSKIINPLDVNLRAVRKGDTKYPLIRIADGVANKIYNFLKKEKFSKKTNERLLMSNVTFKFENYLSYF